MGFADEYIKKYLGSVFQTIKFENEAALIVVIPCFDEPEIATTLQSLFNCSQPKNRVGVIVVVNDSEDSGAAIQAQNRKTVNELNNLKNQSPSWIELQIIYAHKLPKKWAGVGWARKIGMDAAIVHFNQFENENGIIASLDADALVAPNYFEALEQHFQVYPNDVAATIYFEHPLQGNLYSEKHYEGVVLYELYMRYYKNALAFSGFPHAMYTVGSCFAVKATAYIKQGGMNRKKAGEDFYFLHKLPPIGNVGEIVSTKVIPSERTSNRVPFGTGPVLQKWLDGDRDLEQTYPLEAFLVLKQLFSSIDELYKVVRVEEVIHNSSFSAFLAKHEFQHNLDLLIQNCASFTAFKKRFFHLFNAFTVLKWFNFSVENGFPKSDIGQQTIELLKLRAVSKNTDELNTSALLHLMRNIDKEGL